MIEVCEGPYKGMRCTEEIFRDLRQNAPRTLTVCHVMKPEDVDMALMHPNIMLASDGLMSNGQGHPRGAGSFPHFLCNYVKTGRMSLDEAIAKMTAIPAAKLGLSKKGTLCRGADADVVIFDLDKLADKATFASPNAAPEGIDYVIIDGQIAMDHGEMKNTTLGHSIRK